MLTYVKIIKKSRIVLSFKNSLSEHWSVDFGHDTIGNILRGRPTTVYLGVYSEFQTTNHDIVSQDLLHGVMCRQ